MCKDQAPAAVNTFPESFGDMQRYKPDPSSYTKMNLSISIDNSWGLLQNSLMENIV